MLETILKKLDRQNPRTNGKSKPKQTKSHREAYTYTLTKREKGKNIFKNKSNKKLNNNKKIKNKNKKRLKKF